MTRAPVLVLQHQSQDHAAYLRTWLERESVPHTILNSEIGQTYPRSIDGFAAIAVLGGEYGANDERASLRDAERLIEDAFARDVPVLGHCLGGQLMARVLGAAVRRAPAPEIGWLPLEWTDSAATTAWIGGAPPSHVFQWHYDGFDLPSGTERVARSEACPNQAFAIGPHLAMQFHVEVDSTKLEQWLTALDASYASARRSAPATVQAAAALRHATAVHLMAQQALATRIYRHWLKSATL